MLQILTIPIAFLRSDAAIRPHRIKAWKMLYQKERMASPAMLITIFLCMSSMRGEAQVTNMVDVARSAANQINSSEQL